MSERAPDAYVHFGRQVARLQVERGLTIGELAKRSGIEPSELVLILDGEGEVDAETILLLSKALKIAPGELLDGIAWVRDDTGGGEYRLRDPEG